MSQFLDRRFLNDVALGSTSSVYAFHGTVNWRPGSSEVATFLEIADCRHKIRLHPTLDEDLLDFADKLELLRCSIDQFIIFLRDPSNHEIDQSLRASYAQGESDRG